MLHGVITNLNEMTLQFTCGNSNTEKQQFFLKKTLKLSLRGK